MLIEDYELEICDVECVPSARGSIYSAKVHFDGDVSGVMPYLNAVIDHAEYSGNYEFISWRDDERKYILRPGELAFSAVMDRPHALKLAAEITGMINDTWARKGEIVPAYDRKKKPQALTILKLLPGTNCGNCGEPACMAFAVKLSEGTVGLEKCPSLHGPENEEALRELKEIGL
ncbi:MAG: hypothetical protein JXA49_06680 [Actinobacteria bacterium]|nr:hypothetical protein [Actinomycetota bacterium]